MSDLRQYAPATERNRQPILEVLQQVLPAAGTVLEISSGTGEHITFFASQLRHLLWLPSEPQAIARASIRAWSSALPSDNLLPPLDLDVSYYPWPVELPIAEKGIEDGALAATLKKAPITAMVNINMIHISAWQMCDHLMAGAQRVLPSGGVLYLYGPYKREGQQIAPSNEAFDQMLRDRNPEWGIRDLAAVVALAEQHDLSLEKTVAMPANNFSVVFRRR